MGTLNVNEYKEQMSRKMVAFFLLLISFAEILCLPSCNPDNKECSCADTSSQDCEDFSPSEGFHVDGGIEECMEICKALNPLGKCEWLLYHYSPLGEEKSLIPPYINCELFATDDGSLDQYVNTCDKQGQPTRRHDGSCTATATNPSTGECNESICPSGCAPCDETDDCHRKYHETECSMLSPAIRVEPNTPDFDFCIALCTSTQDATYATWSHLDHNCMCYASGERLCKRKAVRFGFSQDDIDQCLAEPGAPDGILVIGGVFSREVEFWSAVDPLGGSCKLDDYPFSEVQSDIQNIPTANFVSDQVVNCYEDVCDVFRNGEWSHLVATMVTRYQHSSAVYQDKVLLIGGMESNTTEWITLDGSSSLGPFEVAHGFGHCTIQVSP